MILKILMNAFSLSICKQDQLHWVKICSWISFQVKSEMDHEMRNLNIRTMHFNDKQETLIILKLMYVINI